MPAKHNYYAFYHQPRNVFDRAANENPRAAGTLYKFETQRARGVYLGGNDLPDEKDSYDCPVSEELGEYRSLVHVHDLPRGWKTKDAVPWQPNA